MAVFRVEKNTGYTVMSNHHLRSRELSLKAKGLLSQMLSLPEDWDYTLAGLAQINRESKDAIRSAVRELEKFGYIQRRQTTDEQGKFSSNEYIIYEQPQPQLLHEPLLEKPLSENPTTEKPMTENPTQINKDKKNKEIINTDQPTKDSFPFPSPNPFPLSRDIAATPPERKGRETKTQIEIDSYREIVMDSISYDALARDYPYDREMLDEILDLIVETICTARKHIRIAGDDFPTEMVKAKFMKLNSEHIRFVMECVKKNTTEIRNIKQYLKAVLFNAPSTIGSYYTALVAHDMAMQ